MAWAKFFKNYWQGLNTPYWTPLGMAGWGAWGALLCTDNWIWFIPIMFSQWAMIHRWNWTHEAEIKGRSKEIEK